MKRVNVLLVIIFVLGFIVRLYRFDNPVADWHAFRQSDTNAVSIIFAREGINFLYPKYFDISNIQSGKDNPLGYRYVEFPIYNAVQASLFNLFGGRGLALEEWGRLISIVSTLGGAFFIYKLTKKYISSRAGFLASFFYLFLPYSVFYGRTILPDPSMASSILGGIYFFDLWVNSKAKTDNLKFYLLSFFFTALAFLLKPYALFFTLPMVYLAWKRYGAHLFYKWQLWVFLIISLLPLVLWRWWVGHFPEGVPASSWLFNGDGIRFRPAFFRWIGFERITKLILGYTGALVVLSGVWGLLRNKNYIFPLTFLISSAFYVLVIATGNVRHDYYQIAIIPTIAMFAGIGADTLLEVLTKKAGKLIAIFVLGAIIMSSIYFSWNMVRDYFNINDRGMVAAGKKADSILPKNAIVIAPYDGSTTFLNITSRRGWPTFQEPIEKLIDRGATYLVIANPTKSDFEGFGKMYKQVASSKDYLILRLK